MKITTTWFLSCFSLAQDKKNDENGKDAGEWIKEVKS
jgi:hypothetical protein